MATSPKTITMEQTVARSLPFERIEDLLKVQKAAQKISSILDLDLLVDKVVHDVARTFGYLEADIYLYDEEHEELVLAGVCGCTCHEKGHRLKVGKEGLVGHVAATRLTRYAADVRKDPYYIACESSTLSEVAIPLLVDDKLVGVFAASHPELDAFPPAQLRLLQALCGYVAVAVQNAQLFQKERQEVEKMNREALEARAIQQGLLPKSSPYIPGFAVSGLSISAGAVGGDWYDFIPFDDGRWGLVLADVSGKGTAAALLMSATRGMLRSLAACCSPGEVLKKLNHLLAEDFPIDRFVTMVYAVLDPATRTVTFVNAGHPLPLLITGGVAQYLDAERGLPLGLGPGDFSEVEVVLEKDSRLVFYSDGITEAENSEDEQYGLERLQNYVLQPGAHPESLLDDVRAFANSSGLQDDASVIFVNA